MQQCPIVRYDSQVSCLTIATGGSCTPSPSTAGWGVIMARPGLCAQYMCGPLLTTGCMPYVAGKLSNNTAELAAMFYALQWICSQERTTESGTDLLYDSTWAANVIRALWRPRHNVAEVLRIRTILMNSKKVCDDLRWHHVRAHLGHHLNELADTAAKLGAGGRSCLVPRDIDFEIGDGDSPLLHGASSDDHLAPPNNINEPDYDDDDMRHDVDYPHHDPLDEEDVFAYGIEFDDPV